MMAGWPRRAHDDIDLRARLPRRDRRAGGDPRVRAFLDGASHRDPGRSASRSGSAGRSGAARLRTGRSTRFRQYRSGVTSSCSTSGRVRSPRSTCHRHTTASPSGVAYWCCWPGPFANFLFAVCAYWMLFVVGVPALKPVIGEVRTGFDRGPGGPARPATRSCAVGAQPTPTRETAVLAILDGLMDGAPDRARPCARADGSTSETALRFEGSTRGAHRAGRAAARTRVRLLVPDRAARGRKGRFRTARPNARVSRSATASSRSTVRRWPISPRS